MSRKVSAHVTVSGVVQGVGFRDWTARRASSLGLTGWVKNVDDGRVEAVFEGSEIHVAEMIQAAHRGPSLARVDTVEVTYQDYSGGFEDFRTMR